MTFDAFEAWWWPYLFILAAGWLATDIWRFAGVALGGRLDEGSELLVLVRCVATALVAAVIGNLIVFPQGPLVDVSLWLRLGAASAGFIVYLRARSILAGIVVAEATLALHLLV